MGITSGIQASLSGMRASATRLHATAHNVANVHTDDFKAVRVVNTPASPEGSGVATRLERSTDPGYFTLGPDGELSEGSNVDLAEEAIHRIQASRAYEANLVAAQSQAEMDDALFRITA